MFESLKNVVFSPVVIGLLLFVVVLGFAGRSGKSGEAIKKTISSTLGTLGSMWSQILFAIPGVSGIAKSFIGRFDGAWAQSWMDRRYAARVARWSQGSAAERNLYAQEKDEASKGVGGKEFPSFEAWMEARVPYDLRILRGTWVDRLKYAEATISEKLFPSIWKKNIPDDLKRSLVSDGKLITGGPMSLIAECSITPKHLDLAAKAGATAFVVWFSLLLTVWHPGLIMAGFGSGSLASSSADVAKVAADDALISRTLSKDYWDQGAYKRAITERKAELNAPSSSEISPELVAIDLFSSLVVALAVGLLMGLSSFRGVFRAALSAIGQNIHDGTKEQIVRWKHRFEQRTMEYAAYCAQLDMAAKYDLSPLVDLGKSTGIYRFRGRLDSPYANQRMKMSLIDLKQNMLIIGGTGQGKTRTVIKPLLNQLLEIRRVQRDRAIELRKSSLARLHPDWDAGRIAREAGNMPKNQSASTMAADEFVWPWGVKPGFDEYEEINYPLDLSTYLTDGKAVFYHDMKEIAAKLRLESDLMVIGTNEDAGEVSVDLLDGIQPQLVADIIRSVARQSGGGQSSDDFWPDMAAEIIRNCAVVARAFDKTNEGVAWVREHNGERPYSLVFIYELAMDNGSLLHTILQALGRAEDDANLYPSIKEFHTTELDDACRHLQETWLPMVSTTRDGIKANIINILGGFGSNPTLRASFAGGAGKNQVSADQFWGRLCVTNVSTQDFGVSGRIINVFLKILFMTEAAKREKMTKFAKAHIEHKFFRLFPLLSEADESIEELRKKLSNTTLYTRDQIDAFTAFREAAEAADTSLSAALAGAHIELPSSEGELLLDISAKERLLDKDGAVHGELVDRARDDLEKMHEAKASFTRDHRGLARKRIFLSDSKMMDPRKLAEAIRARKERILEDIAEEFDRDGVENTISTEKEAIRAAHELYCKWRVLHTRLDGSGEGAIREQMFFIADEYQTLITVDTKEGAMSDSSFPNISRSTGTAIIAATQSYAALKQAVGEVSADNFCHQMRTKVFLQVEDPSTIEFIKKLSGKSMRSYVYDAKGFESYDAMMMMQSGVSDLAMQGVADISIMNDDPTNPALLAAGAEMALSPSSEVSANDAVHNHDKTRKVDTTFVPTLRKVRGKGGHIDSNEDQIKAAMQQATWRTEDLQHKSLSEGNQDMEVFRDDDFTTMGRNHAYMFVQRAGKSRQDFVMLDDEENRKISW